ncbi:histidine kinase [Saccharothrix sp. S26]|uniref:sensor histidine kinase n=1 Tax=Saccharothrix sp. S26 TaxID=2907215 RepID=UPI001F3054C9|nr:histidine kinase [Saccharothrix sp. S26]MCE6996544.1 histidine kinase [Saccharothrix sp. S26]
MARTALLLAVVVADTGLAWLSGVGGLAVVAAVTAAVLVVAARRPLAAFPAAVAMALVTGGSPALLACTSYQAGRRVTTRRELAAVVAAALAYPVVLLALTRRFGVDPWPVLARVAVLVALPLAAGLHFTRQTELERTRERLRIAADMHDSLGRWLSLVTVRAAALEVAPLPAAQRPVVRDLAHAARTAVDELHAVVAALRDEPGLAGVDELVDQFRRAGVAVTVERSGARRPIARDADHAAYRVVQEGLTNATRHAPGRPVVVSLDWQPDGLLVTVTNPTAVADPTAVTASTPMADSTAVASPTAVADPTGTANPAGVANPVAVANSTGVADSTGVAAATAVADLTAVTDPAGEPTSIAPGTGLTGLAERVRAAGGLLRVRAEPDRFRVVAMLPVAPDRAGVLA